MAFGDWEEAGTVLNYYCCWLLTGTVCELLVFTASLLNFPSISLQTSVFLVPPFVIQHLLPFLCRSTISVHFSPPAARDSHGADPLFLLDGFWLSVRLK